MERYRFCQNFYKLTGTGQQLEKTEVSIKYKCLICGSTFDWDDAWDDVKKAEVKAEVETHYNEHIIPDE